MVLINSIHYVCLEYETPPPVGAPTPTNPTPTPPTPPTAPTPTAPTPTAPTPTPPSNEPEECEDSYVVGFRVNINGRKKWRDCEWAADKPSRCNKDVVKTVCPDTCGTCSNCVDTNARLRIERGDRLLARNCAWVAEKKNRRCDLEGVAEACRETCGLCD